MVEKILQPPIGSARFTHIDFFSSKKLEKQVTQSKVSEDFLLTVEKQPFADVLQNRCS